MNPATCSEWVEAFAAGVYLFFGLIHLDLWLRRRERMSHLWLALASSGALLVDVSGLVLQRGGEPGSLLPALNLFGVLLVTSSIVELVRSLTGGRPTRVAHTRYALLAGLANAIVFGRQHRLIPLFMIACGVLLLLAVMHALRGVCAGDPESRPIGVGLLILTLLIDILGMARVIPLTRGLPVIGFTTLFLLSARAQRPLIVALADLRGSILNPPRLALFQFSIFNSRMRRPRGRGRRDNDQTAPVGVVFGKSTAVFATRLK